MKHVVPFKVVAVVVALVALATGACAPIPVNPSGGLTPTVGVFVPQVGSDSGALTSPLQPTAAVTNIVETPEFAVTPAASATSAVTPTVELASPSPVPTATPYIEPPTLVGPVWEWLSSSFKDGTILAPADPWRYTLRLVGDGTTIVQADCNSGSGAWQESDGSLTFGPIATTKMACPADSLDAAFLAQLRNAVSYRLELDGLSILLKDDAGTMHLRIARGEGVAMN